ncbi:TPA: EpsG family protein [Morganella morganii]
MKKYLLPLPLLLLINPLISLLYSLFVFIKRESDISLFFSLSLALILIYFPLMYDTSNHFYYAFYNKSINLDNFEENIFFNSYITLPIILGKIFNIDYYYFFYLYTAISLYFWSKIVYHAKTTNVTVYNVTFIPLLILLLSFNYRDLMDLNRSFLSYSIVFYFILCKKNKNIYSFSLFFYFSLTVHFTVGAIWMIYFISRSKLLTKKFYYLLFFTCIIFGFIMPYLMSLFQSVISLIPGELGAKLYYYSYGSNFAIREQSVGPILKKSLSCVIIILFCFHLIHLLKTNNNLLLRFTLLLSCITLLFFQYVTFFERLNLALTFLYSFILISYFRQGSTYKLILVSLLLLRTIILYALIYFPIFLGNHNIVIPNSYFLIETELKPFYYPTPLLINIENGYSDENISRQSVWGK